MAKDVDLLAMLPAWYWKVPYVYERYPGAAGVDAPRAGANCQLLAYSVLAYFGLWVPPVRSSELWDDTAASVVATDYRPLDLLLFNATYRAYGAHVGVYVAPDRVLHLCREIGAPTVWSFADFARRPRYRVVVGAKRFLRRRSSAAHGGFVPQSRVGLGQPVDGVMRV